MRFSLVVATLGRPEIRRLLLSLSQQRDQHNFEVIVVEQGDGNSVAEAVAEFSDRLILKHLRSDRGLSRARNAALAVAKGEILAFPDDDCWYAPDLLTRVDALFQQDMRRDGVSGRCVDEAGKISAGGNRRTAGAITVQNVWHSGVSTSLFLRREIFSQIGEFDVALGLGSDGPFQSGEETDVLLRALALDFVLHFDPDLTIFHPPPPSPTSPGTIARSLSYALGMGRVLRLHQASQQSVLAWILRGGVGSIWALLCFNSGLARLRLVRVWGIWAGWRAESVHQAIVPPAWVSALIQRFGKSAPTFPSAVSVTSARVVANSAPAARSTVSGQKSATRSQPRH